jgi:hypothetical protein
MKLPSDCQGVNARTLFVKRKTGLKTVFPLHRRSLLGSSVVCLFLLIVAHASAQDTKTKTTTTGSAISINTDKEIPAATEPCTPEECDWWSRLREAGNKLLRKGDQKSKSVFASLFVEGIEKSYRVPLADRPPYVLVFAPTCLQPSDLPAKQRNGTISLSVENRADGSVGEVKVVNGLRPEADRRCIQSARNIIFLPAIKDRQFVTQWSPTQYKISTERN